jgi:hypothetical protein
MFRRGGRIAGGPAPCGPFAVDWVTDFTGGDLNTQNGWKDYGAGADDFLVSDPRGLYGAEDGWGDHVMARDTTACALSQSDSQYAYFIFDQTGGSNGEKFGVALRANATADTFVFMTYNENSTQFECGYVKATQTDVGNHSYTVADADSITAFIKGDSLYVYDADVHVVTFYDAGWPNNATNVYLGVAASGGVCKWYMTRWGGGEP